MMVEMVKAMVIVYDGGDEETGDKGGAFGDEGVQVCFWITKRRFDIRLPRKATRTQRLPRDPNQTNFSRVTESDNRYKKKITQPHTSDRFSESDHTPPE